MESRERMLEKMEDAETGKASRLSARPSDPDDVLTGKGFRLWMSDTITFVVIPALIVLVILIIGVLIAIKMTGIPSIQIVGTLTGPINATLEKGGHAVLRPDLNINLTVGVEKGLTSDMSAASTSASGGGPSIVVRGRRFRLRVLGIIALTVVPVLSVLVVMLITVFIILRLANIPGIYIVGKLNGPINASLGTLGHAVLYPDLDVNLRIGLGY